MLNSTFIPSILMPEIYYPVNENNSKMFALFTELLENEFYESFEISDGFNKEQREQIFKVIQDKKIILTQWFTFLLEKNQLDFASFDEELRFRSIEMIKNEIQNAAQTGVHNIALVTAPEIDVERRYEAHRILIESLITICEEANKYNIKVLLEPLDQFAHKKRLIGTTEQIVKVVSEVRKVIPNISIAFDTAHCALNEENIIDSIYFAHEYIDQIHFSNAVLNKEDPLYGDFHIDIGTPGFLTIEEIENILQRTEHLFNSRKDKVRVAVEVRGTKVELLKNNEQITKSILQQLLKIKN